MKRLLLVLTLALCALAGGCVKYRVTLNNGETFTVLGKPKFDKVNRVYTYKSGGEKQTISAGLVTSIEPASDEPDSTYKSSGY
ncbi:YgdI/YgdR family lipoprotein [bacterium]|nr:YgdI/YgdR family lipoprotein [bacterium]